MENAGLYFDEFLQTTPGFYGPTLPLGDWRKYPLFHNVLAALLVQGYRAPF